MQNSRQAGRRARAIAAGWAGVALLLGLAAAHAAKNPTSADWQADAARIGDPRLRLEEQRFTFTHSDVEMAVELLDANRRTLFLKSAGVSTSDPFHEDNTGMRVFTFLVRMENVGGRDLLVRPQSFFLITQKPISQATPCDYSCLVGAAASAGLSDSESKSLLKASLDGSETLHPGQRLSKLLVFNRMPEAFKNFVLDFDGLSAGGDSIRFVLPYAVPKPPKKGKP